MNRYRHFLIIQNRYTMYTIHIYDVLAVNIINMLAENDKYLTQLEIKIYKLKLGSR